MRIEKIVPAYKSIIWGGEKLKKYYGKDTELSPLAESWELSLHKDGQSTLTDGRPLSEVATPADLGENTEGFPFFPVLVKLIDANAKLSVQVHPADDYALAHENSLGKTEMWYIADADEGAGIYLGFKQDIDKATFERAIREKTLTDYLKFIPVKAGECYFIPAGTIHAICEGCLICEIQQNSNVTYRVYDYGRVGKDGKPRELHIEKALEVSSLTAYEPQKSEADTDDGLLLGSCEYFESRLFEVRGHREIELSENSFRAVSCVDGEGCIGTHAARAGDTFFVSACNETLTLTGDMTIIVSFVPDSK